MEYNVMGDRIEVEVRRVIRIGRLMRINPSEGWLGIEPGIVTVVAYGTREELADSSIADDAWSMIEVEREAMIDLCSYDPVEQEKEIERLDTEPWVVYEYSRGGDILALPLEEFIYHTMGY